MQVWVTGFHDYEVGDIFKAEEALVYQQNHGTIALSFMVFLLSSWEAYKVNLQWK